MIGHEGLACISLRSGYWTWVTKVDRHFTTWATVKQIVPGVVIRDDRLWKANRRLDTSDARSTTAIAPLGIKWAAFNKMVPLRQYEAINSRRQIVQHRRRNARQMQPGR